MAKIYIIGSVGSGKTTLAKRLSKELNILYYELDSVTWEYHPNGPDRRRSPEEVQSIFQSILSKSDWIMENVGKEMYSEAYEKADLIIYIDLRKDILYRRIIVRWLKQKVGLYQAPVKPTLHALRQMLGWAKKEKNHSRLENLEQYRHKIVILNEKTLDSYHYSLKKRS